MSKDSREAPRFRLIGQECRRLSGLGVEGDGDWPWSEGVGLTLREKAGELVVMVDPMEEVDETGTTGGVASGL